ncbi:low molecular weight phosphotyrosine protein phosphatase [Thermodesulfobacteriota bacterium]
MVETAPPFERPSRILFVCSGNLCRSPMAEGLFKSMAAKYGLEEIESGSAGTLARQDIPATEHTRQVAAEGGVDLSGHQSRKLTAELITKSDLILTMELEHIHELLGVDRGAYGKAFLLSAFSPDRMSMIEVQDPYACDIETYRECYCTIEAMVRNILEALAKWDTFMAGIKAD